MTPDNPTSAAADSAEVGPLGVLIVDDQTLIRHVLRELVSRTEGMAVVGESSSGEAALEAVRAVSPSLVIMDVRMPGMGGVEAARRLVARDPGLIVFLISAEPFDRELVLDSGAALFARKHELSPRWLQAAWEASVRPAPEDDR